MNKPPFIRIVSLVMAVLLLVSSTGFVVVEHTCEMKGKTLTAHLGDREASSCCGTKVAAADSSPAAKHTSGIQENPCCKEKAVLATASAAVSVEASSVQLAAPATVLAFVAYFALGGGFSNRDTHPAGHPYAGPPPVSSSLHKALLCTWLI
ncbi:HYC_CC_PP family protein [Persicitalea jodogahamensis]|uniref:HYC_CC_PP family protein n=1 Tax=Persicitalea jodogahamensis TaxID=402147 RepID=UPI001679C222|nr:hypothetical protein [Persicitalea jodogahamensis]